MLAVVLAVCTVGTAEATDHVVKRGETVGGIAAAYHTTVAAIVATNNLPDADHIGVGQVLVIPLSPGPTNHTVTSGQSLASIAARYHTTVSAIVAANSISNPDLIRPGQVLIIPGASVGSTGRTGGHVVQPGETVQSIAAMYGVSPANLAAWNGILSDPIYAGARLLLSSPGSYQPSGGGTTAHTVRAGETLSSIATSAQTTMSAIVAANGISNPNLIRIGAVLQVPGGMGFSCPVPGARFSNDWGMPRSGGRWHEGNDLFAPTGTPVYAPVSGTVENILGSLAGLQFRLVTAGGTYFVGSHLSKFGESGPVNAGEVIGYVGNTGNASGGAAHLHFEIHPSGGPAVNPYPTLVAAC